MKYVNIAISKILMMNYIFITERDFHAIQPGHLYEIVKKCVPNFITKINRDRFVEMLTSPDELRFISNSWKVDFNGLRSYLTITNKSHQI